MRSHSSFTGKDVPTHRTFAWIVLVNETLPVCDRMVGLHIDLA